MSVWLENLIIVAGFGVLAVAAGAYVRTERWQRAFVRLRKNRAGILASCVLAIYIVIGLADSIHVARDKSLLDLVFKNIPRERGYSAPLAATTYNVAKPQKLNGLHPLGTDLLGK